MPYISRQEIKALLIDTPFIWRPYPGSAGTRHITTVAMSAKCRNTIDSRITAIASNVLFPILNNALNSAIPVRRCTCGRVLPTERRLKVK